MGFYGTLKMIFYKVSRISARIIRRVTSSTSSSLVCVTRSVAYIIFDAPLTADRTATAEDEQQCSRPPETRL